MYLLTFYFQKILDLQKNYKDSTMFPHNCHPASPNDNVLYNHSTVIKTKKLNWYKSINYQIYLHFTSFSTYGPFLFQDPI